MRFNSLVFAVFLVAVLAVFSLLPGPRARKVWLLVASYAFYASWQPLYLALLFAVAVIANRGGIWVIGSPTDEARKQRSAVVLVVLVTILGLFKYLDWLIGNLNLVIGWSGHMLPLPHWVLPLGVSFYVFEALSYILECRKKKEKAYRFWDFQLYLAFFPHLIAGPILRAKEFFPQLQSGWKVAPADVRDGLIRIAVGLALKVVLADSIAPDVDKAFARDSATLGAADVVVMSLGFGAQIYFDFSAYSSIAIGAAKLFGLNLVENFNFPLSARNPSDFWNRWHMSLSRWIRDYLFFAFAGRRLTLASMCRASVLSMALCGLWHGANWTFVLWGLYHGLLIAGWNVIEAWKRRGGEKAAPAVAPKGPRLALAILLTNVALLPGWYIFRAASLSQVYVLSKTLVTFWAHRQRALSGTFYAVVAVVWVGIMAAPLLDRWSKRVNARLDGVGRPVLEGAVVGVLLALSLLYLRSQSTFIYFQF